MYHLTFLQDLAVVMAVAAVTTIVFRQLNQPVVLGYILAGVLIGPHTPPFALVAEQSNINTLAELGVIFLMFALGLEFSLRKLKEVGVSAFIAAALEILLMIWAGYALGQAFGWNQMDSIFLGAILSISSTTIIIKALEGLGKTREHFAKLIFGILIVEDILAIVLIALLSGFAITGRLDVADVGMTVLSLGSFLGILLVAGLILVPRLLNYVARFKSNEMLLITVVGLCFGISLITVKLGYSVALGAFLIGAIIAEARQIAKIELLMSPIRDLFSAVFFVSIGLLIDPELIMKYALPICVITIVVVVGKVVSCSLGCFVSGNNLRSSLRVGMGLAQIGEFSFIIAALGLSLKVTSDFIYPIAVAVSALTTLFTPYLIRGSDGFVNWFDGVAPKPLLRGMEAYSRWVNSFGGQGAENPARKILVKVGWQIGVNVLLVIAIFIAAIFLYRDLSERWPDFPGGDDARKAAVWLVAMLVSFPLLVALWRKLRAAGMMIAEVSVQPVNSGANTSAIRSIVSNTIMVIGITVLFLLLLALSMALLPSQKILYLMIGVAVIGGILLYRSAIKLYARAQGALQDTFSQLADAPDLGEHVELPPLLREAKLELIVLGEGTIGVGKILSELQLRNTTGASIVGIERRGEAFINPPAHEELEAGDQLLLIGNPGQLQAAKEFFSQPSGGKGGLFSRKWKRD